MDQSSLYYPSMTPLDKWSISKAVRICAMYGYPDVKGDPNGMRCSGDCECAVCGKPYLSHPLDWRLLGYEDRPFLHILCSGERVKL